MKPEGTIIKYGDHVDTDVIIPARYLSSAEPAHLAAHCMEDLDPDFPKKNPKGAIIAAGKNFGCGSSREHAPLALKASGIACIIAESFARIFYRNAINIGLPIVEAPEAARDAREGDILRVDFDAGVIDNITQKTTYSIPAFPPFMQELIAAGGLSEYTRKAINS